MLHGNVLLLLGVCPSPSSWVLRSIHREGCFADRCRTRRMLFVRLDAGCWLFFNRAYRDCKKEWVSFFLLSSLSSPRQPFPFYPRLLSSKEIPGWYLQVPCALWNFSGWIRVYSVSLPTPCPFKWADSNSMLTAHPVDATERKPELKSPPRNAVFLGSGNGL